MKQNMESCRKFAEDLSKSDRVQDQKVGKQLTEILDNMDNKSFLDKLGENTKKFIESIKENGGTILKIALVPMVVQMQLSHKKSAIEDFKIIVRQCWLLVKSMLEKDGLSTEKIIDFLELAFNSEVLESY
jgi:hypothetical protein